jgi:hypothetical protein
MFLKKNYLLISLILIGLFLRLPLLTGSFWLDEAAQALESTRPIGQQLALDHDFQPPLYHFLVHLMSYASHQE